MNDEKKKDSAWDFYDFPTFDKLLTTFGKQWHDKFPYKVQGVTLTLAHAQVNVFFFFLFFLLFWFVVRYDTCALHVHLLCPILKKLI